ncbi:hypothetical protein TIFTF001_044178 [Ficus carica]|uniref:Uncharacterized protein n=1 Tax=Ficus carica TaxID=3494 RepID=A0AA87Z1X0_FICCA|nr:hypothetical protein TIFTF001_044178 [Ficus carica]
MEDWQSSRRCSAIQGCHGALEQKSEAPQLPEEKQAVLQRHKGAPQGPQRHWDGVKSDSGMYSTAAQEDSTTALRRASSEF